MIKKLNNLKFEKYLMFVLILQPLLDIYRTFFRIASVLPVLQLKN